MSMTSDFTRACAPSMPAELAGAVNLMAHPLAGMAAAGALGMGLAGHAFGMWMGAAAGAAEASQKLLAGMAGAKEKPVRTAAKLTLVSSQPAPRRQRAARMEVTKPAAKQPVAMERPQEPDDLKAISGVGPKLEKVLNDLGIWTHAQLAALTGAEIAWLDERLGFAGRIGRDGWVEQAAALAAGRQDETGAGARQDDEAGSAELRRDG